MVSVIASSSNGNAYALQPEGEAPLLIEAGVTYRRLQVALKHQVSNLAACLISHEHQDHARAAREVMRAGVDVYATPGTLAALKLTGHRAKALPKLKEVQIGRWTVLAFPAVHDAAEPCGFLIGVGRERILYATDSAYCAYTFPGLTEVMVEANYSYAVLERGVLAGAVEPQHAARVIRNHLSLERCIELLKANDLSRVRAVHLLHLSSGNADEREFKAAVERATGVPTYVAAERSSRDSL